jgi:hypothetical protein
MVPERELKLDIHDRVPAANTTARIVEIAKDKQPTTAVIAILPSITACEQLENSFENCFVFGRGRVPEQLGCLETIGAAAKPYPIILTTSEASLGHDITKTAYVIQITLPDCWATFVQNAGRSNRIDPTAPLVGAFITSSPCQTIDSIKTGCEHE